MIISNILSRFSKPVLFQIIFLQIWDDISPEFLSTFWSLTIYDLYVPEQLYAKKIKQLKAQKIALSHVSHYSSRPT